MEAVYYAARSNLQCLLALHPDLKQAESIHTCGKSVSWVKQ
jgi:hypothetical protein